MVISTRSGFGLQVALVIERLVSAEQVLHGGLGPLGNHLDDPFGAQAGDGVAGDDPRGHGQDEADDAAEEAAQRRADEHHEAGGCPGCGP